MPLCPPQIPHDLTWAQNLAAVMGNLSYGMTLQIGKKIMESKREE
jgi:hypothetical protein